MPSPAYIGPVPICVRLPSTWEVTSASSPASSVSVGKRTQKSTKKESVDQTAAPRSAHTPPGGCRCRSRCVFPSLLPLPPKRLGDADSGWSETTGSPNLPTWCRRCLSAIYMSFVKRRHVVSEATEARRPILTLFKITQLMCTFTPAQLSPSVKWEYLPRYQDVKRN